MFHADHFPSLFPKLIMIHLVRYPHSPVLRDHPQGYTGVGHRRFFGFEAPTAVSDDISFPPPCYSIETTAYKYLYLAYKYLY